MYASYRPGGVGTAHHPAMKAAKSPMMTQSGMLATSLSVQGSIATRWGSATPSPEGSAQRENRLPSVCR